MRRDQNCLTIKSPLSFFVNLFKKKKYKVRKNHVKDNNKAGESTKVPIVLSVSVMDMSPNSCPVSPALSVLTLTPGRTRDIDQDMEALRLSRQDNPYLQVLASRESLVESLFESESDDTNLMSQEFPNDLEVDPLSLPEIHEHMIRSPPPTTWPKSPKYKVFRFPGPDSQESLQFNNNQAGNFRKSSGKAMSTSVVKDEKEGMSSKDFKFIELSENLLTTHSMTQSISSLKNEFENSHKKYVNEPKGYSVVKPTPVRSQSESHKCLTQENSHDRKSEAPADGKYDGHETPLTLPLISKNFP